MELSEFVFRLVLIFLPGLITFFIVDSLTVHKKTELYRAALLSLVYGFISYVIYYFINLKFLHINFYFTKSLTDKSTNLDFREIAYVALLSLPLALVISALIEYKILYRIANYLRISQSTGGIGVWDETIRTMKESNWIVIRDLKYGFTYQGQLLAYSSVEEGYEDMLLKDVTVYKTASGEKKYDIPRLYIARDRRELLVESSPLPYNAPGTPQIKDPFEGHFKEDNECQKNKNLVSAIRRCLKIKKSPK